jgi:hypothetical protein
MKICFPVLIFAVLLSGGGSAQALDAGYEATRFRAVPYKPEITDDMRAQWGSLTFRGAVMVSYGDNDFYGWSGLWVSPDGQRFAAVQQGSWVTGRISYDGNGELSGLTANAAGALLDEQGKPFTNDVDQDAEALDFDGKRFIVGFETNDRVLAYREFTAAAERLPLPPEALVGIGNGAGFSSVVHLPFGTIAMPEFTVDDPAVKGVSTRTRGWLLSNKVSGPISLRKVDPYALPVSVSALPNGDLLLVEAMLPKVRGPITDTKLSRIRAEQIRIGNTMQTEDIGLIKPPLVAGRFEGSSARRGAKGETLIYLIVNDTPAVLAMFELTGNR